MENERVKEEYAYYNIGTNVINATPGLHGNEYMLVDFERVRLEKPLKVKKPNSDVTVKTYADTDKDGLYDRDELGKDGETFEYYDITKFIEKMVLAELYGKNQSVYYNISKAIIPKDVTFRVSSDTKGYKGETSQDYKTAVKKMMEWYTNHIATYQHMHDNIYKDKNGDSYTLYGSNKEEKYYEDNKIASYPINKASLSEIYMTHLSGRGIYYCQPLADKGAHAWVGDDCTGFMMSIAQFYAGNKLKNPDSQDYGNDDFNKNTINSVSTGWFKDDTSYDSASKILKKDADMYTYLINKKTTINDLQFGDILITTSGHAEIYLDSGHTWGWGFKHCK